MSFSTRLQTEKVHTDWFGSWGKVWIRWAFHLNGMFGLYTASTSTRSPTWGVFPFTALKKSWQMCTTFKNNLYGYLNKVWEITYTSNTREKHQTSIESLSPQLKENIFIYKAECVMQLVDNASEDSLFLRLRLLLVTWPWGWVGHGNLGCLLRVRQAYAGGQRHRRLWVET